MLLPPLKFAWNAVNDINRKYFPHWRKAVAPPLDAAQVNTAVRQSLRRSARPTTHGALNPDPRGSRPVTVRSAALLQGCVLGPRLADEEGVARP